MSVLIRNLFFALGFLLVFFSGYAQVKKSTVTPSKTTNQKNVFHTPSIQQAASTAPIQCLNKKLSLAVHVVLDSLYLAHVTQAQINSALAVLNADFSRICLSFFICKQDTILNYKYYKFNNPQEIPEVHQIYEVHNMINVYVVGSIIPPVEAGFASRAGDYMVLSHGCLADPKCWSHEMGHFFSLAHTFDVSGGVELVNESNCSAAGDSICDTPADINPAPISGCQWVGTNTDTNGDYYTPIIGNIMSYHPSACKTPFTVGQLNKMVNWYISYRNYLY
jgi:hypothetical protein